MCGIDRRERERIGAGEGGVRKRGRKECVRERKEAEGENERDIIERENGGGGRVG